MSLILATSVWITLGKTIGVPVAVAALTAAATLLLTRASDAANRRRDHYADAVATLVAWIEFPYRIRRRTDDLPETLAALAARGHDLQEKLACHQAWIGTESSYVANAYKTARTALGPRVGASAQEAWNSPPISSASEMNLGAWGPAKDCSVTVDAVMQAVSTRFGWRRLKHFLHLGTT
jgi:hypothetical protein